MPSRATRTAPTEVSTVRWTVSCACEATFSTCVRTSVTPRSRRRSAACALASALRSARRSAVRALAPAALRARVVAAFLPAVERRVPAAFAVAPSGAGRAARRRAARRRTGAASAWWCACGRSSNDAQEPSGGGLRRGAGGGGAGGAGGLGHGIGPSGERVRNLLLSRYDVSVAIEHTFVNPIRDPVTPRRPPAASRRARAAAPPCGAARRRGPRARPAWAGARGPSRRG